MRSSNNAAVMATHARTAKSVQQVVNIFQKGLKIFHKAYKQYETIIDKYETIMDMIDILSFDPQDLTEITGQLAGAGINAAVDAMPQQVFDANIRIPSALLEKVEKLWGFAHKFVGHHKVQEVMGEIGTAVIISTLGYKLQPLTLHAVNGPDQVAQQEASGTWGIFEAKGGNSKLSTDASYGPQMKGQWITHWIDQLIDGNQGTEYGTNLRNARDSDQVMLAAVTRLNVQNKSGGGIRAEFDVSVQKYESANNGISMDPWGPQWY
jgi:hypothetical protein